jgi:cell division protein FtsW
MAKYLKQKTRPDFKIALLAVAMSLFGIIMIASASDVIAYEKTKEGLNSYVITQSIALVIGIILMVIFSSIDYRNYKKMALTFMIITVVALIAVFLPGIGYEAKGAHRWINLGFTTLQPSEFAKITFIVYLCAWLDTKAYEINSFKKFFLPFIAMLSIVSLLIILQPDLGTLTTIVLSAIAVFFVSGAPAWQFASMAGFLLVAFSIFIRSKPYRWQRFLTYLDPSSEVLGSGYHVNQAFIAVSQGGLWGLGFGKSIQKMEYLPEPHTDSIFAIICEELGFMRSIFVIIAFVALFVMGMGVAKTAPDKFGRLLAVGITASLCMQALINIAAMLGLVPLTGVTLPFISYGGNSLVVSLALIGILLNISRVSKQYV